MKNLIALAFAVFLAVPASAQSLVELAAKAKAAPKATKIYTDKGVRKAPVVAPEPATAATPAPAETVAAAAPVEKNEAYWKNRMHDLVLKMNADVRQMEAATENAATAQALIAVSRGYALGVALGEFTAATAESNRWRAVVNSDMAAVRDLEEEARVAGVIPGWLRWP